MPALDVFRQHKDRFFKADPHSPLLPEQRDAFDGLKYYPDNPALRFELAIEPFEEQTPVTMQTSTGDVAEYLRWGRFAFEVDGEPAELTVYLAYGGGGYFLPFMDATNSEETYSAGRYLEIEPLAEGQFLVDFNLAYNPYCAYNGYWSCPVPPKENRLKVPIRAGEMKPPDSWVEEAHA
jgi:uncharacterized protein (DUF1684 family)